MNKLLLTPCEAAQVLGISRSKVYELLAAGAISSVKIGAARRIPLECLVAFIGHLQREQHPVA